MLEAPLTNPISQWRFCGMHRYQEQIEWLLSNRHPEKQIDTVHGHDWDQGHGPCDNIDNKIADFL